MDNKLQHLIKKYETYVSNIEWDTKTNERVGYMKDNNDLMLKCYKEALSDIAALQSVTLVEEKEPEAIGFAKFIHTNFAPIHSMLWIKRNIGDRINFSTVELYELFKNSKQ